MSEMQDVASSIPNLNISEWLVMDLVAPQPVCIVLCCWCLVK